MAFRQNSASPLCHPHHRQFCAVLCRYSAPQSRLCIGFRNLYTGPGGGCQVLYEKAGVQISQHLSLPRVTYNFSSLFPMRATDKCLHSAGVYTKICETTPTFVLDPRPMVCDPRSAVGFPCHSEICQVGGWSAVGTGLLLASSCDHGDSRRMLWTSTRGRQGSITKHLEVTSEYCISCYGVDKPISREWQAANSMVILVVIYSRVSIAINLRRSPRARTACRITAVHESKTSLPKLH